MSMFKSESDRFTPLRNLVKRIEELEERIAKLEEQNHLREVNAQSSYHRRITQTWDYMMPDGDDDVNLIVPNTSAEYSPK